MTLTVHHLRCSQSERVVFLCEELGIPYTLKTYDRAPILAPPEYKALHPSGAAPVIQDTSSSSSGGDDAPLTLAESGACMEYISQVHGQGRLFPSPSHPSYPDFLYWWHWGNGTLQPSLGRAMMGAAAGLDPANPYVKVFRDRVGTALRSLDARVRESAWLAGEEFSAADVMVVFSLTTFRYWYQYSLAEYGGILDYLGRVSAREAYKRAMEKGDPGMELALGAEPPKPFQAS